MDGVIEDAGGAYMTGDGQNFGVRNRVHSCSGSPREDSRKASPGQTELVTSRYNKKSL